jgi:hypothetical protein
VSAEIPELDPTAAAALASIILERVADAVSGVTAVAGRALLDMADDTGLALDVCAGVLLACSTIMGAGGMTAEAVFALAVALDPSTETGTAP